MDTETTINQLKNTIKELEHKLSESSTVGLFMKFLLFIIMTGCVYACYKSRNFIKWAALIIVGYLLFGDTIKAGWNSSCEFVATSWNEAKENSAKKAKFKQEQEMLEAKTRREIEKTKAEAEAQCSIITTESETRLKELKTKEQIEYNSWVRVQAEERNDAINKAIISGTYKTLPPKVTDVPEVVKDIEPVKEKKEDKPEISITEKEGDTTTIRVIYKDNLKK